MNHTGGAGAPTYSAAKWSILQAVTIVVVYVLLTQLGHFFAPEGSDISPIWPPSGFASAVLILAGRRYWPAITVGSLIGNGIASYLPIPGLIAIVAVDTLEALAAYFFLTRLGFHAGLTRVRDILTLIAACVFGSSLIASVLGNTVFYLGGITPGSQVVNSMLVYWSANATANLTVAPLLFAWMSAPGLQWREWRQRKSGFVELMAVVLTASTLALLVWFAPIQGAFVEMEYVLFPLLLWAGLRFGVRIATVIIIIVSLLGILGSALSLGPFAQFPVLTSLTLAQLFIAVFSMTGLVNAALAEERASSKLQLSKAKESLEQTVAHRTIELNNANAYQRAIMDNIVSPILACNAAGEISLYNRAAHELFREPAKQMPEASADEHEALHNYLRAQMENPNAALRRVLRGEGVQNIEYRLQSEGQETKVLSLSGQKIIGMDNQVLGAVVAGHDITEQKYTEEVSQLIRDAAVIANEAPDTEQAVSSLLSTLGEHTGWAVGHALAVVHSDAGAEAKSTGWWYAKAPFEIASFQNRLKDVTFPPGLGLAGKVLETEEPVWISDLQEFYKAGRSPGALDSSFVSAFAMPVTANGHIVAILEFFNDQPAAQDHRMSEMMTIAASQLGRVYEREQARQKLVSITLRDPLTKLPNRVAFLETVHQALAHAKRRNGYSFAVLFLDLDRFKVVNDSLGHTAGDKLLIEVACRIAMCLRDGDSVARLGGDEFTVYLDDLGGRSDSANAARVAQRIVNEISEPMTIEGEEVYISCSIGVVIGSPDYTDANEIIRDADAAMYRAKAEGKSRIEIFSPQLHANAITLLRLENDLRRAIERQELVLYYQPVINLFDQSPAGFEALVRWIHPEQGMIPPLQFIPVAEETGIIMPLGRWIMHEACQWAAGLSLDKPHSERPLISVNVSGRQFSESTFVQDVALTLDNTGLHPTRLKLEIVESTLMVEPERAVVMLEDLRNLGVEVVIDDFGTGYSSLSYLAKLPIDALKIDRAFIADLTESDESAEIVRCILAMAAALKIEVVAEGIETEQQVEALLNLGCALGQGYFYAQPMEADAAQLFIESPPETPRTAD